MSRENRMRRGAALAALFALAAACRGGPMGSAPTPSTGAATPQAAVEMMLAAAQAQDLQGISAVWGNEEYMTRDRVSRDELEKRAIIMSCLMRHTSQKVGAAQLKGGARYIVDVDLTQATSTARTTFEVAKTPSGRWLVADVNVVPLQGINRGCAGRG